MYIYYKILGAARDADDKTIRKAYLDLVKKFPPERHPEEFKRITRAFEAIKDRRSRVASKLMGTHLAYPLWTDALADFLVVQRASKGPCPGLKDLVEAQKKDNGI